ncbi:MAG: L,D-transpeptidase family protein [Candidatus Omnitrophota bacterium]|jgi:lipoprotein-anchoring transpeptidase ErfK/SrfK|nr:L,D-transpeptidase family protein [Candidatus Omnitrophota bacterium]
MNNKLVGSGIGLVLLIGFLFIIFGTKSETKIPLSSEAKEIEKLIKEDKLSEAKEEIEKIAQKKPELEGLGNIYFDLARAFERKNNVIQARDLYSLILNKYQNVDNILEVQEGLGKLNISILFSPIITSKDVSYTVEPGDSLSKIAKKFGTTIGLIKASNSLKSDVILANSKLKVSKQKYGILVDKSQNVLTLLSKEGDIVKVYSVSTGENNSTPVGTFKIVNRIKDPVWYNQGAIVPSESPDNVLGSRWLGFSKSGYGIHGTVDPDSVGTQATKGCVRMHNHDVEELYTIVAVGTKVTISD